MRKPKLRPFKLYLRPGQAIALRAKAKTEKVAMTELVRRGVDQLLLQIDSKKIVPPRTRRAPKLVRRLPK